MHPRLRHVPPKEPASMSATLRRSKSSGITTPPEPEPMTARSNFCTTGAYGRMFERPTFAGTPQVSLRPTDQSAHDVLRSSLTRSEDRAFLSRSKAERL